MFSKPFILFLWMIEKGLPFHQAASVLREMYKKFPVLYNTSMVSSFEPKVIYKVTKNIVY